MQKNIAQKANLNLISHYDSYKCVLYKEHQKSPMFLKLFHDLEVSKRDLNSLCLVKKDEDFTKNIGGIFSF